MPKPQINRTVKKEPETDWERAYLTLVPLIIPTLAILPNPEFTTRQFVSYLRATDPGELAYTRAVSYWKDNHLVGRQTIHGQIIPQLLKDEAKATWQGYVYGTPEEDDGLAVPARWLKPGYAYPDDL